MLFRSLLRIESERCVTHSLKPDIIVRLIQFRLWRSEYPLLERLVEMVCVIGLLAAVLKFHSIGSSTILRFEVCISQKCADKNFTLNVGKLQGRFSKFDFA